MRYNPASMMAFLALKLETLSSVRYESEAQSSPTKDSVYSKVRNLETRTKLNKNVINRLSSHLHSVVENSRQSAGGSQYKNRFGSLDHISIHFSLYRSRLEMSA